MTLSGDGLVECFKEEEKIDPMELEESLFVLSVTLSNSKTYLVEVKKNVDMMCGVAAV